MLQCHSNSISLHTSASVQIVLHFIIINRMSRTDLQCLTIDYAVVDEVVFRVTLMNLWRYCCCSCCCCCRRQMSVDVDWEYEDITLERVCLSSVHFLWLCHSIHLHVIIVKLPTTPAHIYQLRLIRVHVAYSSSREFVDLSTGPFCLCTGTVVPVHAFIRWSDSGNDICMQWYEGRPDSLPSELTLQNIVQNCSVN